MNLPWDQIFEMLMELLMNFLENKDEKRMIACLSSPGPFIMFAVTLEARKKFNLSFREAAEVRHRVYTDLKAMSHDDIVCLVGMAVAMKAVAAEENHLSA